MYSISHVSHPDYGDVVTVERVVNGEQLTPFRAVQCARTKQRILQDAGIKKVRFLIDNQVLSFKQAEQWAEEEYKTLPKCSGCAKIMEENVFIHRLSTNLFCSQICSDRDYNERLEKLKDEEDIEYL